jgi:hypothetical protein
MVKFGKFIPAFNYVVKQYATKVYRGSGGIAPPFLIWALDGDE